jgi:hypothetical protein
MDARAADDEYDAQTVSYVDSEKNFLTTRRAQSFVAEHRPRQTTDPRAEAFLQKLARVQKKSRILITSRLYPRALEIDTGHTDFGCYMYILDGLSNRDAFNLWRALRVEGSRAELVPIFRSVKGHPLVVQALASEVANYRKAPCDFAQWRADHPQFDPTSLPLVQSHTHILEFALNGLSTNVREVLNMLVGFSRAVSYVRLEALLVGPVKPAARNRTSTAR